jgi:uncharacterized HAD superfamily protein
LTVGDESLLRKPICIDIDNTIADTDSVFRRIIQKVSRGRVNLEHEDVICYEYVRCRDAYGHRLSSKEWQGVLSEFHRVGLSNALPLPEISTTLAGLKRTFEIHLATARDSGSGQLTRKWLSINQIPHDALHFVKHGEKHQLPVEFALAIEDDREQAYAFQSIGVPSILLSCPWNVVGPHSPLVRLPDWEAIVKHLLNQHVRTPTV